MQNATPRVAGLHVSAVAKGLKLSVPTEVRETMGSGVEGVVDGRPICVGSHQLVYGARKPRLDNGCRDNMMGGLLNRRGNPQNLVGAVSGSGLDSNEPRATDR